MGWASGSQMANSLWEIVREHIKEEDRKGCATKIYQLFCEHDADDWSIDDELVIC